MLLTLFMLFEYYTFSRKMVYSYTIVEILLNLLLKVLLSINIRDRNHDLYLLNIMIKFTS